MTPYGGILCTSCGGKGLQGGLKHINWALDDCKPDHVLVIGQRFFRDGTAGDAVMIIKNRIRLFNEKGDPIPPAIANHLLEDARRQTGEWQAGWPMVDRWDEAKKNSAERKNMDS